MPFNYLSQLIKHFDYMPKCPQKITSLLKNYKGVDWALYTQYQTLYPHEIKLWKNNAHDLSLISLFPKQSYTIYQNSVICLLTGTITTNEQPYVIHDKDNAYNTNYHISDKKITITSSQNEYTSFFIFKNYKDLK